MTEPRDKIDAWLEADVQPLPPPPGTFERISTRARHRKASRALMSVAGAAVVIAAGVAAPQMVSGLLVPHSRGLGVSANKPSHIEPTSAAPTPARPTPTVITPTPTLPTLPTGSALSPQGSGQKVPPNFQPGSVTFVNGSLGAAIGQAGTPGKCSGPVRADCTSLAGTFDYGKSWFGVSAPVAGAPDGSTGVSQLRFLDGTNGWAFGPQLWVTHDGGKNWQQEQTYGLRVTDLETAGNQAFAVFATCTGSGPGYAGHCSKVALYSSPVSTDSWRPVRGTFGRLSTGSGRPTAAASLVLVGGPWGGTGYLLAPGGAVFSGPLTGSGWKLAGPVPASCALGLAQRDGTPSGVIMAAGSGRLYLACSNTGASSSAGTPSPAARGGGGASATAIFVSGNGGANWRPQGTAPGPSPVTWLAAASGGLVVAATATCLQYSTDNGVKWRVSTYTTGTVPAGGFSYVGMTNQTRGVAVPANPGLREVYLTTDGGRTWRPSQIQGHAGP